MRLNASQHVAIQQAARETLPAGTAVYLFGSRTDDARRGGDIDLLVESPSELAPQEAIKRRTRFAAHLYRLLDEQRIDILMAQRGQTDVSPVVQSARRHGIKLVET